MDYEYRNIDTDLELKKAAKKYWKDEFTKEDMYLEVRQHGYSEWEADKAINDYYQVYIQSKVNLDRLVVFWSLTGIIMLMAHIISLFLK